jgi:hypothetical protein
MNNEIRTDIIDDAERLMATGEWSSALALLVAENNRHPDSELERKMVDLRIKAFREMNWPAPEVSWPPAHQPLDTPGNELPEITPNELDVNTLRSGILGNGGLIVRGLMDANTVREMHDNLDRTLLAARGNASRKNELDAQTWFTRSEEVKGGPAQFFALGSENQSATASIWAVDSPRTANQLIQFYQSINLPALLQGYFSEPAALSVKKWVLRRVAPDNGSQSGWHQDGRFLGDGIRTVNLWIALTDCGGDADSPGMDIVGGGNKTIYETGTHGAPFEWTVGQGLVDELGEESPVLCPRFAPGDAIFFDHYNLHRTAFGIDHTQTRYALESWFFAASRAPAKQIPVFF